PVVAHALGVFSATFLYALMFMAWVDRGAAGRVPLVSGWLVLVLLLASMGIFIALIDRLSLLQVNRMLAFTGEQGRIAIDDMYPSDGPLQSEPETIDFRGKKITQTVTYLGRPQVIQAVNLETLLDLATQADALIEVAAAVGNTVTERTALLR